MTRTDATLTTLINGQPAEWTREIWQLWYTHALDIDPKYQTGQVTRANYFTPRPAVDEYNRGSNKAGFTYTVMDAGRNPHVYQVSWIETGLIHWPDLEQPPAAVPLIHAFSQGRYATALCGSSNADDQDAPASEDWTTVTCPDCLAKRPQPAAAPARDTA